MSGSEPSDAIRAVNALLTQLDALRRHPNALVLTTSNITQVHSHRARAGCSSLRMLCSLGPGTAVTWCKGQQPY